MSIGMVLPVSSARLMRAALLSFVLLLGGLAACPVRAGDPPKRTTALVRFEPLRNHGVPLVQVRLNNQVTGTFMIDTGASDCLMTDSLAKQLGLKTQPAYYHGFLPLQLGEDQNDFATVKRLQIGPLLLTDAAFLVIKHDDLFKFPEQRVDGIIGGALLSHFALFVDFPQHMIGLISPGGLSDQEVDKIGLGSSIAVPLKRQRITMGTVIVPVGAGPEGVRANEDIASRGIIDNPFRDIPVNVYTTEIECRNGASSGKDTLFVDSGAPFTSISQGLADRLHLIPEDKQAAATMYNGSVFGNVGQVASLRLGGLTLLNPLVAYPGTKSSDIPPLLGEDVLAYGVALFDFPREKLYLRPTLPPIAHSDPSAKGPEVDVARLRQAAETFSYAPDALATDTPADESDLPAQVTALQKKVAGDASDAELYVKIGNLLRDDKQDGPAQTAFAKAVELRRAALKAKPTDPAALAALAEALCDVHQEEEAEKTARQAVAAGATEPKAWAALGTVLHARSLLALTGQDTTVDISDDYLDYEALIAKLRAAPPSAAQVSQAQALSREARDCFDKAVTLAPNKPEPLRARAEFLQDDGLGVTAVVRELRGEHVDLAQEIYPAQFFADKDQLAALSPNDPAVLREAALDDVEAPVVRNDKGVDYREGKFWKSLPGRARQSVQDKMDRLGILSKDSDPVKSSRALSALGELQYQIVGDETLAEATLRRALALDPGQAQASRAVAALLSSQRRYDDLAALLNAQIGKKDTAQLRLLLARTLERQGRWEQAETQARAALKVKPDSFSVNLALAMLLLRRSDGSADVLAQAQDCMAKAQAALGTHPDRARSTEFNIAVSILAGLSGDTPTARQTILDVLADNRTDTQAREVLAALVL